MFIVKNARKNVRRNIGRNLLLSFIMIAICGSMVVSFLINSTSIEVMEEIRTSYDTLVVISEDIERIERESEAYLEESIRLGRVDENGVVDSLQIPMSASHPNMDSYLSYGDSKYVKKVNISYEEGYESDDIHVLREDAIEINNANEPFPDKGSRLKNYTMGTMSGYDDFNSMTNKYFLIGERKIQEGTYPQNEKECIISIELAELNNLVVGDTFEIMGKSNLLSPNRTKIREKSPILELKIVGIYFDGTIADSHVELGWDKMLTEGDVLSPAQNRRNNIITTAKTLENYKEVRANDPVFKDIDTQLDFYPNVSYTLYDANDIKAFQQELYDKGMSEYSIVEIEDKFAYDKTIAPIMELGKVSDVFLLSIIGFGACLLLLISLLSVRVRTYEIGVLRAMGLKKMQIVRMFIWESIMISVVSVCIAFIIGIQLGKPIVHQLLQEQSKVVAEENRGEISSITLTLQYEQYAMVIMLALGLGILASLSGIFYTVRFEPRKILSERE